MTIFCYHEVHPEWESPLAVTPSAFDEHMAWLARNRTVVGLRCSVGHLDRRGRLPDGMAAVTFDDGLAGVLEHAVPSLERWGMSATVFVVADTLLPGQPVVDWVDDPPDWQLRTLTAEQVRELRDRGFTIGSHTSRHRLLPELTDDELRTDLRRSREILEEVLHEPVGLLAYPRGLHDERTRQAVQDAGFDAAFSLPERREPVTPYSIPRVGIYRGETTRTMRVKAARAFLPARTHPVYTGLRGRLSSRPRRRRSAPAGT